MEAWIWIVYIVALFAIMYFISIRPQKKEQKRHEALMASLEAGDSVCTTAGFYGVVIGIEEDMVIVEFGSNKNCRIPMKKSSIIEVEKA
ncbi:MAG: preprotein translocase subunit YajC [Lachnospiraceae bacterium]|nr:preprotein translocase subunit YajC [Lachnospiraceae bacterium]